MAEHFPHFVFLLIDSGGEAAYGRWVRDQYRIIHLDGAAECLTAVSPARHHCRRRGNRVRETLRALIFHTHTHIDQQFNTVKEIYTRGTHDNFFASELGSTVAVRHSSSQSVSLRTHPAMDGWMDKKMATNKRDRRWQTPHHHQGGDAARRDGARGHTCHPRPCYAAASLTLSVSQSLSLSQSPKLILSLPILIIFVAPRGDRPNSNLPAGVSRAADGLASYTGHGGRLS